MSSGAKKDLLDAGILSHEEQLSILRTENAEMRRKLEDRERRLHLLLDRIDDFTLEADTPQTVTGAIREFFEEEHAAHNKPTTTKEGPP